jgi:hypothetical protein
MVRVAVGLSMSIVAADLGTATSTSPNGGSDLMDGVPDPTIGPIICEPNGLRRRGSSQHQKGELQRDAAAKQASIRLPPPSMYAAVPRSRALAYTHHVSAGHFLGLLLCPSTHDLVERSGGLEAIYPSFG